MSFHKTSSSTKRFPLHNVLLYKTSSSTKRPLQNILPTKRPSLQYTGIVFQIDRLLIVKSLHEQNHPL